MSELEWPTEKHLGYLREQGIVAYSSSCTKCLVIAVICAWIIFKIDDFNTLFTPVKDLSELRTRLADFLSLIWLPAVLCIISVVASALAQTKFLFLVSLVYPSLDDFTFFPQAKGAGKFVLRLLRDVLEMLALYGVIYFTYKVILSSFYNLYTAGVNVGFSLILKYLFIAISILMVSAICTAVLLRFCNKFVFLIEHRMTSEDVENEAE